jgi:hypothetical protein
MPGMQSVKRRVLLPGALVLAAFVGASESVAGQSGGGPAAFYSSSYTDASWNRIFELHRSWGNVVPGGVRSPNGLWCVHPDYRPGQVLVIGANGRTITCTVGDMVQSHHVGQWRSRWAIELSWSAFVALDLQRRNYVDFVQLAGVGGGQTVQSQTVQRQSLPTTRYFSETGFTVGHAFLDYWRSNGGLAVFGYPLSNELEQNGLTIQFFERAVFEFHPDKSPEHRVLLRRLGAQAAADLRHTHPFQPVDEASSEGGRYFDQTGHRIASVFNEYWTQRGGIPIFGLPISAPFEQDGLVVQYFERAVFELHPDKSPEHRVLLRRLGADAVRATQN